MIAGASRLKATPSSSCITKLPHLHSVSINISCLALALTRMPVRLPFHCRSSLLTTIFPSKTFFICFLSSLRSAFWSFTLTVRRTSERFYIYINIYITSYIFILPLNLLLLTVAASLPAFSLSLASTRRLASFLVLNSSVLPPHALFFLHVSVLIFPVSPVALEICVCFSSSLPHSRTAVYRTLWTFTSRSLFLSRFFYTSVNP